MDRLDSAIFEIAGLSCTDAPEIDRVKQEHHCALTCGPKNYKWINTNQIERTWEQMHLAYEYGVDKIWIVNVGDIKPMEFPTQFFLGYAWNPSKWNAKNLPLYNEQRRRLDEGMQKQ